MKRLRIVPFFMALTCMGGLPLEGRAQAPAGAGTSSGSADATFSGTNSSATSSTTNAVAIHYYAQPSEKIKLKNYFFDAFGPYPIAGALILGGIDQAKNAPPEWGQGFKAYGERAGSDFGIELATTTTRYALAEAFREDTIYYRCECSGLLHRMSHAMISTVTARRGRDGHRRLSFPALIAPYAGSMTAVYGWYPGRYDAKDGLRMGNYALLTFAAENIAREFIYGGPHTLFSHLNPNRPPGSDSMESSSAH
jgi:hypothetical protein